MIDNEIAEKNVFANQRTSDCPSPGPADEQRQPPATIGGQACAEKSSTREQVHELRNRLYASSLALCAICRMLDDGKPAAARAAAEAMLSKLRD